MPASVEQYCRDTLICDPPAGWDAAYQSASPLVANMLYRPTGDNTASGSIEWAVAEANRSIWPLEPGFVPFMPVDEASFACVYATPLDRPTHPLHGKVFRWHLTTENIERQRDLLDVSVADYVRSAADELECRSEGLVRMLDQIGPAYEAGYLVNEKRPRDFVIRPVRLACQNVIVGLAAFSQDATIDGLSVYAWQTCEVPHVATHDGNRALAALMLCDAFKNGGTMEIRFDRPGEIKKFTTSKGTHGPIRYDGHPEGLVPASLRRYGRTLGVEIGVDDPASISPREARALFLAVTPMPVELRGRVEAAVARGLASPERMCFTLMSQLWREIELDFMLAVSDRSKSILGGGSPWQQRASRQAEASIARATRMVGMLYRRLDTKDVAGVDGEARVLEDNRVGIDWSVVEDYGAVLLTGTEPGLLPWQAATQVALGAEDSLVAVPRATPTAEDVALVRSLQADGIVAALVVPGDCYDRATKTAGGLATDGLLVLSCPERLGELDQALEAILLTSRMTRQ